MNKKALTLTLAMALPASLTFAQGPGGGPPPGGRPPGPPPGQQGDRPPGNRQPRDRERPDKPPVPPLIHALDADRDGIISAEEINGAPDALATLDRNKDGKLTPNEFQPQRPDGPPPGDREGDGDKPKTRNTESDRNRPPEPFPGQKPARDGEPKPPGPRDGDQPKDGPKDRGDKPQRPPGPPLIHALDTDRDGVVSADEISAASKSLTTLDRNEDGQLGPAEYAGRPPGDRPPGDRRDGDGPKPPRPPQERQ